MRSHLAVIGMLPALGMLPLAGCAAPTPPPPQAPTASSVEPIFASEEEALAAAEATYAEYVRLSDAITAKGEGDISSLERILTRQLLEHEREQLASLRASGLRTEGNTEFDFSHLQSFNNTNSLASLVVYVCADVSKVRIVDPAGTDLTPPDRVDRFPLLVEFVGRGRGLRMQINRSEVWQGESFC